MSLPKSQLPPYLNNCSQDLLLGYFKNAWELEDILLKSIIKPETFYINPDPLRNPLIFYLGHSAAFYINKLIQVDLLQQSLNSDYEILFELGVDPENAEELNQAIANINWPQVEDVWNYRNNAYEIILEVIKKTPLKLPIHQNHPLWALVMGIEHQRIHFETSSMLLRQLPTEKLECPSGWQYAPSHGVPDKNEMILVGEGTVKLGKDEDFPLFGWDCEYGKKSVNVEPFYASKYLITNADFLEFVNNYGYETQTYWDEISWQWKEENNVQYPKFWQLKNGEYSYRAMFDEMSLPLDWPVEVNYYEAKAYCRWKGKGIRLMREEEWNLATYGTDNNHQVNSEKVNDYNLNLKLGSPSPVGFLKTAQSESGLCDLRGNVWEWLDEDFDALPGFKTHFLYEDNAAPFFDNYHKMMLGGAWVTQGTETLRFYRNWFRPSFYQHAGFRIVQS
ncbi:MAG: 5-histidylcysteine sulfoxide synthase [Crocosphaera sp.]|nr:5-histidylcysteine sulfoxide synthase [Crocosphaera sp.]